MLKFLRETDVAKEFLNLKGDRKIAVAFWGMGAPDILGLDGKKAKGAMIICNLESGATNPEVIKSLQEGKAIVKSNPQLHGKVYAVGDTVIMGSSNASGNGLAVEGKELTGWIEANILTDDVSLVGEVTQWFDELWNHKETLIVDDEMLKLALVKWKLRRSQAPVEIKGASLLEACRSNPVKFDNVYLAIYNEGLSEALAEVQEKFYQGACQIEGLSESFNSSNLEDVWVYGDGWNFQPNDWIIDVDATKNTPKVLGYSKAIGMSFIFNGERGVLTRIHKDGVQIEGNNVPRPFKLSREEEQQVINGVKLRLLPIGLISLVDAVQKLDGVSMQN